MRELVTSSAILFPNIRRLMGDMAGARRDWQRVDQLAPGTQADTAARANLQNLAREQQRGPAAAAGPSHP